MNEDERQRNIARERANVMLAFADEKPIQGRNKNIGDWVPASLPIWDFEKYDYRIKPEPRVIYVRTTDEHRGDYYYTEAEANGIGIHNFTKFQEVP